MNMRKSAMFAVVLVAAQMFFPADAENVLRKVGNVGGHTLQNGHYAGVL